MIYFQDNFLDKELFDFISKDLIDFKEVDAAGKKFWVIEPTDSFNEYMTKRISLIEGCKIKNILSFFRQAKENQDNTWRIHNDSIINNEQPDRAIVYYISDNKRKDLNGTAFWKHKEHGFKMADVDSNEFNRLLIEDANDTSKWQLESVVGHKKNRLLSYPCNYFHSKYPNEFKEDRVVFVMFYKISNERV